jgi:hypothetical protein
MGLEPGLRFQPLYVSMLERANMIIEAGIAKERAQHEAAFRERWSQAPTMNSYDIPERIQGKIFFEPT